MFCFYSQLLTSRFVVTVLASTPHTTGIHNQSYFSTCESVNLACLKTHSLFIFLTITLKSRCQTMTFVQFETFHEQHPYTSITSQITEYVSTVRVIYFSCVDVRLCARVAPLKQYVTLLSVFFSGVIVFICLHGNRSHRYATVLNCAHKWIDYQTQIVLIAWTNWKESIPGAECICLHGQK